MKSCCYSVTMVTKKFVQPEFDRVIQKEIIDITFANFEEDLMLALSWYIKNVKNNTYISYGNNGRFIFHDRNTSILAPFNYKNGDLVPDLSLSMECDCSTQMHYLVV